MNITAINKLKTFTGVGILDSKKALSQANGDFNLAIEILRKQGHKILPSRYTYKESIDGTLTVTINKDKTYAEILLDNKTIEELSGTFVGTYIHPGDKIATIVSLSKIVDDEVLRNICLQITAMSPIAVDADGIDPLIIDKEIEIIKEQLRVEGKPEVMLDRISKGKMIKFYNDYTLLNQDYIKKGEKGCNAITVAEYLKSIDKKLTVTGFKRVTLTY